MKVIEYVLLHATGNFYWKDRNSCYLGCNQTFAKIANLATPEEIIGKYDRDLFLHQLGEDGIKKLVDVDQAVIAQDIEITTEELGVDEFGEKAYYISKKVPLKNDQDEIIGVFGISFNINDRKEMERLRIENTIIEQRASTAATLAASIAHELRTPLATINSLIGNIGDVLPKLIEGYRQAENSDLVAEKLKRSQLALLDHSVDLLQQVTKTANTFVEMMLMKVNLGNIKLHKMEVLSIKESIQEALAMYPLADGERLLIHDRADDFKFNGENTLLRHVFFNLLKNALYYIKAADKGEIEIYTEQNETENLLHFKDTGNGIASDILPYIFDQFYTNTRHGTGVGLALCKIIMQEFGGDITCHSVQGEFADFILHFPFLKTHD